MTLHPNSTLQGGKYRIVKVLGQGSFGITYLAEHTALARKVAIKEFFMKELNSRSEDGSITGMSESSLSFNYAQKFRKEAQNLSRMDHPNIVRVTDSFEENGTFYYVMDYIEGENLNDYVKKHPLSEEQAISIICDVAEALTYMHEKHHMLHLDLKPGNIMRRESDGHIFLIDFGLSKHFSDNGVPETSTSIGLGTAGYAPLEQSNQSKNGEFRPTVDVYALGATLYKLLTGETPPGASDVMNDGLPVETLRLKGVSANTIAVVEKAMEFRARSRYQTITEFLESFSPKDGHSDVNVVSTDDDLTTIDVQEKESSEKSTSTNKEDAVVPPVVKEEEERSNGGYLKIIFIIVALCLFILWYNDLWFFSPKDDVVTNPPSVLRVNRPNTPANTRDSDDNRLVASLKNQSSSSNPKRTPANVVEKNGYIKNGDGTITDTNHNLMWMDEDYVSIEGHLIPNDSWHKAMEWCEKKNREKFAGYSDWRVPSVQELITLARPASHRNFCKSFFGGSQTINFWSSNSVSSYVKSYVCMDDGAAVSGASEGQGFQYGGTKLMGFSVRLVRDVK